MESYVKVLNDNSEGIKSNSVFGLMLNAFVSKYACKESREQFIFSQQQGNIELANKSANLYLDCYNNILEKGRTDCSKQYDYAFSCLEKTKLSADSISIECVNPLEDLTQCNMRL